MAGVRGASTVRKDAKSDVTLLDAVVITCFLCFLCARYLDATLCRAEVEVQFSGVGAGDGGSSQVRQVS